MKNCFSCTNLKHLRTEGYNKGQKLFSKTRRKNKFPHGSY